MLNIIDIFYIPRVLCVLVRELKNKNLILYRIKNSAIFVFYIWKLPKIHIYRDFYFFNEQTDLLTLDRVYFNYLIFIENTVSIVRCEQIRLLKNKTIVFSFLIFRNCHFNFACLWQVRCTSFQAAAKRYSIKLKPGNSAKLLLRTMWQNCDK